MFEKLKNSGDLGFWLAVNALKVYRYVRYNRLEDKDFLTKTFIKAQGYPLNLEDPKSLNEKIQWLKINDRRDISTQLADKYAVREYIKENFGEEYLIPLLFHTTNPKDLTPEKLPKEPFIIKSNHDSGEFYNCSR